MTSSGGGSRRVAPAALALWVAALLLHGIVAWQYRADPFSSTYVSDALSYDRWAARIAEHGLAAEPVFHQSPLFPVLLGGVYAVVAPAGRAATAVGMQVLLTSLAVALLVPLGRVFFGSTRAGVAAGCVALAHGPLVFYSVKLLPIPLALATQALALLSLGRVRQRAGPLAPALAGLALGLAFVARSETLLFLPLALVWSWQCAAPEARKRAPALLIVGALVVVAPVTLHNLAKGDRVWIASSAGENLFIGNQRGATGGHTPLDPRAGDLFSQRDLAEDLAEQAAGRDLRPSEISAYWRGRAIDEIVADPVGWLRLELRKLGRILHPGDPTDIYSFALERDRYLSILHLAALPAWGVMLLAGVGGAAAWRERGATWPLATFVAMHAGLLLVFFVSTRLRLPLIFFLCPFAGYAVHVALDRWNAGERRMAIVLAMLIVTLGLSTAWLSRPSPREIVRLSAVLSMQDRLDEALSVLEPALAVDDPDPFVLDQAGWLRHRKGDMVQARDAYLAALARELPAGRRTQTQTRLGQVYEALEQFDEAARQHDAAISGGSANAGTFFERGRFRLRRGDRAGAVSDLRQAVRLDPRWPPPRRTLEQLGVVP